MSRIMYIYPKDYMALSGQSKKTATTLFQTIRDAFQKKDGRPVTIKEFCKYTNDDEQEVRENLLLHK